MNKELQELDALSSAELTDLLYIKRPGQFEGKQITVANFLLSLGIKTGESGGGNVTPSGNTFVFSKSYGLTSNDVHLIITCRNTDNETIGYEIINQTKDGFTIIPVENAVVTWTVILK